MLLVMSLIHIAKCQMLISSAILAVFYTVLSIAEGVDSQEYETMNPVEGVDSQEYEKIMVTPNVTAEAANAQYYNEDNISTEENPAYTTRK